MKRARCRRAYQGVPLPSIPNRPESYAAKALEYMGQIYDIERTVVDASREVRYEIRSRRSRPIIEALRAWMVLQRSQVPDGSATAKALEYSLRRWEALTRFVDDGNLPVDNNHLEGQIHPIAVGKHKWLFVGSLRAGKRASAVMTLLNSARLNGRDPYAYLCDNHYSPCIKNLALLDGRN